MSRAYDYRSQSFQSLMKVHFKCRGPAGVPSALAQNVRSRSEADARNRVGSPMTRQLMNFALFTANLAGIYFYLVNASLTWAIPAEHGLIPAIAGPAMVWGLGALPWVMAFRLIDGA